MKEIIELIKKQR